MIKRSIFGLMVLFAAAVLLIGCGVEEDEEVYNYISTDELVERLDAGDLDSGNMIMVSSQTEEEWETGYLPDAIPTFSRPLETDEDYAKLDPVMEEIKAGGMDVIIICPRGGGGATRPFDYFKENGIDTDRLLILSGGQEQMNEDYPELVVFND